MNIGLIDVDSHNWPNLALMKLSAWHKARGDNVEWWDGFARYSRVYMSRVFDDIYSSDCLEPVNADEVVRGGTGYGMGNCLPDEIEHVMPDYSLYGIQDTAYGFLTRGCPRGCPFCIVSQKEGCQSRKVADLNQFWSGQKFIKLLDPNLFACPEHEELLIQLAKSNAWVDFTQGLDIRLMTEHDIELLLMIRTKNIHFAWDDPKQDLSGYFQKFKAISDMDARKLSVYVLTNYNSTHEEDLYRVYTLRDLGYSPYVMIYNKPKAPIETRRLQRWVNNRKLFRTVPDFCEYGKVTVTW